MILVVDQGCWWELLVRVVDWSSWLPLLDVVVGKVKGCDMSGRVYLCSCTVTVDLLLGSQAGLISYKISISSCWPFKSHKHDIFDPSKALIAGLRVNIAKIC